MYCTYCGSKILEGSKFCETCGRPLADSIQPVTSTHHSMTGDFSIDKMIESIRLEKTFLLKWVLAVFFSIVGWLVILLLGLAAIGLIFYESLGGGAGFEAFVMSFYFRLLTGQIDLQGLIIALILGMILYTILAIALLGLAIGGSEWLVIRKRMGNAHWILRTLIGVGIGSILSILFSLGSGPSDYGIVIIYCLIMGGSIGFLQWPVIRKHFKAGFIWVVSNVVALILAFFFGLIFVGQISPIAGLLTALILYPFVTGVTMVWFLHQPFITQIGS